VVFGFDCDHILIHHSIFVFLFFILLYNVCVCLYIYIYIYMRVRGYMYILINIYKLSLNKQVDPYMSEFTNNNQIELNL